MGLASAQAAAKNKNDSQRFAATFAFRGMAIDMNAKRKKLPLMRDGKIGSTLKDRYHFLKSGL